jgi:hypothetical protein
LKCEQIVTHNRVAQGHYVTFLSQKTPLKSRLLLRHQPQWATVVADKRRKSLHRSRLMHDHPPAVTAISARLAQW